MQTFTNDFDYVASIFNIEQYWSFQKYANENNLVFHTDGGIGEAIFLVFDSDLLHTFICGLDCGSSTKVSEDV